MILSADTDLNGVVQLARQETDNKIIQIVAPPKRKWLNSNAAYEVPKEKVAASLLPETCRFEGKLVSRPDPYKPPDE